MRNNPILVNGKRKSLLDIRGKRFGRLVVIKRNGTQSDRRVINNDGDYEPQNCQWSTSKRQSRNKSTTRRVEFGGQTKSLADWSDELKISYSTLTYRVKHGIQLAPLKQS